MRILIGLMVTFVLVGCGYKKETIPSAGCTSTADCSEGEFCAFNGTNDSADCEDNPTWVDTAGNPCSDFVSAQGYCSMVAGAEANCPASCGLCPSGSTGSCVPIPEENEAEELPGALADIEPSVILATESQQATHVGKACAEFPGFCHDIEAEAPGFCDDAGGIEASGYCDGNQAIKCCLAVPCTAKLSADATEYAQGVCMGTKETVSGSGLVCDGVLETKNNDCPNTYDGSVGCCTF